MRAIKHQMYPGLNRLHPNLAELKLRYMDYQDGRLYGWFTETPAQTSEPYEVYIAVTGETVPDEYRYLCTTQLDEGGGYFVVHAFD